MSRQEDSPRPAPKIIQDVYDAQAAAEAKRVREEEVKIELRDKGSQIHDRAVALMLAYMPNPASIEVPPREKPDLKKLKNLLTSSKLDEEVYRKMRRSRQEKEEEGFKFKVAFPIKTANGEVDVKIMSEYFPEGDMSHTMRIDIPILPHTIEVTRSEHDSGSFRVSVLSREDEFHADNPGYMGSRGRNYPKYNNYASLDQVNQVLELLDFIDGGIADNTIKPKVLTPHKVFVDEAMSMRPWPERSAESATFDAPRPLTRRTRSSRGK